MRLVPNSVRPQCTVQCLEQNRDLALILVQPGAPTEHGHAAIAFSLRLHHERDGKLCNNGGRPGMNVAPALDA